MSDYSLEFVGRLVLEMRSEMRQGFASVDTRLCSVERSLEQLKDEHVVNTAWLMRDKAEPIAAASLQSQLQRMNARMSEMERRVSLVETRLPAE